MTGVESTLLDPDARARQILRFARVRLAALALWLGVVWAAMLLLAYLAGIFRRIIGEMMSGKPLPGLTHMLFDLESAIRVAAPATPILGVALIATATFLGTTSSPRMRAILLRLAFPAATPFHNVAVTALAESLAQRLQYGQSTADALRATAESCLHPPYAYRLRAWADAITRNEPLPNFQRSADHRLLPVRDTIESQLPPAESADRLRDLAEITWEPRDLGVGGMLPSMVLLFIILGGLILAFGMVLPFVRLIEYLGG